ncbi:hypothetical protein SUGI_0619400 [Cryptomeria japonica]|nr:hypothetical protein SUGI_0619400 [Cryptomeria japonica]
MKNLKGFLGDYIMDYLVPGRFCWKDIVHFFSNRPNLVPLAQDLQHILSETRIPLDPNEDNFIWKETQSGSFSVKSSYNQLLKPLVDVECWKKVWNPQLIPKINFFWWSLMHGKTLMLDNLKKRGFHLPNRCSLCKVDEETIDHIFVLCPFVVHLWSITLQKCDLCWVFQKDIEIFAFDWTPPPITPSSFSYGNNFRRTSAGPYEEKETKEFSETLRHPRTWWHSFASR